MASSVFDLFKVGIGPSSSHTVGPMRAALLFVREVQRKGLLERTERVFCELMGSLGATGRGHATDNAVMLGLMGLAPAEVRTEQVPEMLKRVDDEKELVLVSSKRIEFDRSRDIVFSPDKVAKFHTNAVEFSALDAEGVVLFDRRYYSVGGGFIVAARVENPELVALPERVKTQAQTELPFPYANARELIEITRTTGRSIAEIVRANEAVQFSEPEIDAKLDHVWSVMQQAIDRGLMADGVLPGPLKVVRRAPGLARRIAGKTIADDPMVVLDWVNAWAFAVSEENACGGRLVTAPTNGAAGVVPAVLKYFATFFAGATPQKVREFLLTAGAIGMLYKQNASISGAEVGCQGEVGVACSMAAGALAAVLGATPKQVENAAEIGMEHHLGLTCDPVAGQVQIPCIERNAVAAVKAINAARLAMNGSGEHVVSLDAVMQTMFATGRDMMDKYRETSRGGLAVNFIEC